jgi:hypothetical protein
MGSTGNNSGMNFFLDATDEYNAALIQMALDDSGCKYKITSATQDGILLGKIEGSLVFDQEDTLTYKVIRFIIEPSPNPIQQGFEIATIVSVLEDQVRLASSDPEELEFQLKMELDRELNPRMVTRFEELKSKFAAILD